MTKWISVKDQLPPEDSEVKAQINNLFKTRTYAQFIKGYFISKGENITHWVTHWIPIK